MGVYHQLLLAKQLRQGGNRSIVVASYPRSGTHLLLDALRLHLPACDARKRLGESRERVYLDLDHLLSDSGRVPYRVASKVLRKTPRPLVKTHAPAFPRSSSGPDATAQGNPLVDALDRYADVLYIYRDGRETICSQYLLVYGRHLHGAPTLSAFVHERPGGVSRPQLWAEHVRGWLNRPGTHPVQMERLIRDPATVLAEVAASLCLPPPTGELLLPRPSSRLRGRMDRLFTTRPRSTGILGNNLTRQKLDWRTQFTPDDQAFFDEEAGDLLAELGY